MPKLCAGMLTVLLCCVTIMRCINVDEYVKFACRNERGIAMPQEQRYYSYGDQFVGSSMCFYGRYTHSNQSQESSASWT